MALGIAPLTVNEQTTMLATIADNGMYHQAHVVKYWQQGDGTEQMPGRCAHRAEPEPRRAGAVRDGAMTTINGTAAQTVTFGQQAPGTVIGKTGTTSSSHAGFFIGSTTQYTLVVGMFTISQANSYHQQPVDARRRRFRWFLAGEDLEHLRPGGVLADADALPDQPGRSPAATWNLLGKVTKPKPTVTCMVNGHKKKIIGKSCPTPDPTCGFDHNGNYTCTGGANSNPNCDPNQQDCSGNGATSTCDPNQQNCAGNGATSTCDSEPAQLRPAATDADVDLPDQQMTPATAMATSATTALRRRRSATQGGLAVGGVLMVLPGSLPWTTTSRGGAGASKRAARAE